MEGDLEIFRNEFHQSALESLCRICGNKLIPWKSKIKPKLCETYAGEIFTIYEIRIDHDTSDVHPKYMCDPCYRGMKTAKQRSCDNSCYYVANVHDIEKTLEYSYTKL